MKRAPLFIAPEALDPPRIVLRGQDAQHGQHVLRLRVGAPLRVSNDVDTIYHGEVTAVAKGRLEAVVREAEPLPDRPLPTLEIIQVLPKPQLAERILGPCTTLGVSAFHFVPGQRTPVAACKDDWTARQRRWRGIVRAAAAQSEIARAPALQSYPSLHECLTVALADIRFVADASQRGQMGRGVSEALRAHHSPNTIQWLIGPEGGFDPEEVVWLTNAGVMPVSLGAHILRLETAAVAALVVTEMLLWPEHT